MTLKRNLLAVVLLTAVFPAFAQQRPPGNLPPGVKAERDIPYVANGGPRQILDLYLPAKPAEKPLPLVIWIHGGAWSAGSKDGCPFLPFVNRGFAVASINYRLSQMAIWPAQIQDCKAAVRFLRANAAKYNLDPDHFGVGGGSAGGHLVAVLGTAGQVKELEGDLGNNGVSSRVQAVCDLFGPTDLLKMAEQAGPNSTLQHDSPNSPESKLIGGAIQENKEKAKTANPITYVSKDSAPFLIMHGDKDPLVPLGQSQLLEKALKDAGVEVTLKVIEGAGHGGRQFNSPEANEAIEVFFNKHLKAAK